MKARDKKKSERKKRETTAITVERRRGIICGLIPASIALLTFVAFLPILHNGFVNWDDESFLLTNPNYRGLGWRQIHWMFTTCYLSSCMPLTWMTYGLDYVVWGMDPLGYHLTSLIIHAANAVLLYFVSLRLFRHALSSPSESWRLSIGAAAASSALFFSLHPLRVGAVAWILGREMVVAGFFLFWTLLCYLRAAESDSSGKSRWPWMTAAWLFYALSLLGKEAALTLPFALFILDIYPLRRFGSGQVKWFGRELRSVWWEKLPFLLLALAAGVRAVLGKQGSGALYSFAGYGLAARVSQVLYSLAFYPWKTAIPVDLSPLYPLHPFNGFWNLPFLLSAALVLALTVGLYIGRHYWPAALAAWACYGILLIPVSGIVAFGPYRAADHFSYVTCIAWAMALGAAWLWCWKLSVAGRFSMRALVLTQSLAVLMLMILGTLTWTQAQIWKDSEHLWRHALSLEENSSFAHNNLGLSLAERGAFEEAIKEFQRAVEIDPMFVEAHTNLGNFLARRGSSQQAIVQLHRALEIDPGFVNARNTLANILADKGELDQAIGHLRKALEANSQSAMTHYNLGRILARHGDLDAAITQYRQALQIDSGDAESHNNLGLLLLNQGDIGEATEQFRDAIEVNPNYARAYFNLGKLYAQENRLDDAVQNFQQALQIEPEIAEIHESLARTLSAQGRKKEALEEYQEAMRLLRLRSEANVSR